MSDNGMTRDEAIAALLDGKKLRRESWSDFAYIKLEDGVVVNQTGLVWGTPEEEIILNDGWFLTGVADTGAMPCSGSLRINGVFEHLPMSVFVNDTEYTRG